MKKILNTLLIVSLCAVILSGCSLLSFVKNGEDLPKKGEVSEDFILGDWTDNVSNFRPIKKYSVRLKLYAYCLMLKYIHLLLTETQNVPVSTEA